MAMGASLFGQTATFVFGAVVSFPCALRPVERKVR